MAFYFVPSSMARAGLTAPAAFSAVALSAVALSTAHIVLNSALRRNRLDRNVLALAYFPLTYAVVSAFKGDTGALISSLIAVALVLAVSQAQGPAVLQSYLIAISIWVATSVMLSALDSRFAVRDRDYLPLIVDGRAFGLAGHPNTLGLLAGLTIIIGFTRGTKSGWPALALALGGLGLLAAGSNTAILGTGLAAACVLVSRLVRKGGIGGAVTMALGVLAAAWLWAQWTESRAAMMARTPGFDDTFTGRTHIWEHLLGLDVGWFGLTSDEFTLIMASQFNLGSAHNLYIEALARGGYVGLAAVLLTIVALVARSFRGKDERRLALTAFFVVTSITEGVLLALPFVVLFAATFRSDAESSETAVQSHALLSSGRFRSNHTWRYFTGGRAQLDPRFGSRYRQGHADA